MRGFRKNPKIPACLPSYKNSKGEEINVRAVLNQLVNDGAVAIEDYYSVEYVDSLRAELEELRARSQSGGVEKSSLFDKRFGYEDNAAQGVFRFYHADQAVSGLSLYRDDLFIKDVTEAYYGRPLSRETIIYQFNVPTEKGTRGWHVDSWVNQFKPFLYLSDVSEENGPFTYLLGSHKNERFLLKKLHSCLTQKESTDVSERDVEALGLTEKRFLGKKGTLILADTKGIHRGGCLRSGSRSAAVLYLYA